MFASRIVTCLNSLWSRAKIVFLLFLRLLLSRKRGKHLLPETKCLPLFSALKRLPEINHRRRVCLVRACAPLPHLRISLCVLEYFLFEPLVPLAFCCGSDKHCSCHFVCLYCVSVLSPCGEEVIVRHLYGCVTAGQMDMWAMWTEDISGEKGPETFK